MTSPVLAIAAVVLLGTVGTAGASSVMIATCSPPTGLNVASDIERDRSKDSVPEVYDSEAKAYVSHPRNTSEYIITVNNDGTATETSYGYDGTLLINNMRILGSIHANSPIDMVDDSSDILTLYPKESIAVFVGTSYIEKPVGYVYISHCKFSRVLS